MISHKAIQYLYDHYNKRPESPDCLALNLLFEIPQEFHNISIDEEKLEIGSICNNSPFRTIALNHINAIIELEETVAIVLSCSIIFLSKLSQDISIDIKNVAPGFFDKLSNLFQGSCD